MFTFEHFVRFFKPSSVSLPNQLTARKMSSKVNKSIDLRELFLYGVNAVHPKSLFGPENFRIECDNTNTEKLMYNFNDNELSIAINGKQCHLVGFGKGVYGMAHEFASVLNDRIKFGILSVPIGTKEKFPNINLPETIQIYEGAKNNLPDELSVAAAKKIVEYTKKLNENDILFVLITGGGSALLPLPCNGVSLAEKCSIIKQLAAKGADIVNMNSVRINLSQVKGGKLAENGKMANTIITFIVSDVIGDLIHSIASGPTVVPPSDDITSIDILKKFNLWQSLPPHIQNAITTNSGKTSMYSIKNVKNTVIATNRTAIRAAVRRANENDLKAIFLSSEIAGDIKILSESYKEMADTVLQYQMTRINAMEFQQRLSTLQTQFQFSTDFVNKLENAITNDNLNGICVIGGGEPTVEILGNGVGGRNQELALRFSMCCFNNDLLQDVQLLSAGTDGIDGK